MEERETDCKVCQQMMKEKHRFDFAWKVACVIFFILAVIFAVLYFGSGAMVTETTIEIGNDSQIEGNVSDMVVGSDGSTINGTVETKDDTGLMIFLGIIGGCGILVVGGAIIAHYIKESNYNSYVQQHDNKRE